MSKRFWKVDDPLFESLPNYDKTKIQELLKSVQLGRTDIKDELTLQLLSLCKVILQKRLYKNPALQRCAADLVGNLMLRTCTFVDEVLNQNYCCDDLFRYYCQIIKNAIYDFNMEDNPGVTGSGPNKQYCQRYRKGRTMPVRVKLKDELLQVNPTLVVELEDILLTLAETDHEREVIVLRFQNYTESEIADKLGVTQQWINQIRVALEKRYDEYLQRERLT
ncbi:MAG: sigma factor-like helix-turn-helix DNA-binding protein [Candidatus Omnitrophota bacterium]|jgi:hypothetical protein